MCSGKLVNINTHKQEFKMRPIFVGNFEYDTRQSELERIFAKYGRVERVDMKSGFAFVYMEDERDAEDAIRGLDNREFGRQRRRLSVEWARGDRGIRHREGGGRAVNLKPTKTLFVINFDPYTTRVKDLERHFEPYGRLLHVRIRRNFAFVQYETQEEATKALECTHMSKLFDRVISVEYAIRDDDDRSGRQESPVYGRRAERGSPGYGRPDSPIYGRRTGRASPDYGRPSSPVYDRYRGHSPVYDRYRSRSPTRRLRS
uniref:TSA: Wollemia nobilis Ref_Wollemi_Transcript_1944_1041 transcribed RNA sequence n=1 Tax=Wollemia nobilis TaxID=56998 RepID=A0A0C9RYX6_9CONI